MASKSQESELISTQGIDFDFTWQSPQAEFTLKVGASLPGQGVTAVFGRSGSGKTSLLRCLAGLQRQVKGHLTVAGQCWQKDGFFLPCHKRPLGYVFQEASLFPQMTARANLTYAIKRTPKPQSSDLYQQVLALMAIESSLDRYPAQLSGGERQRLAIARALLIQPRLLLMDEPLASLDQSRKQEILPYLEKLSASFNIPIIYVTHSIAEVARLADHMLGLEQGRLVAQGGVTEVLAGLDQPLDLGEELGAVFQAEVLERDTQWDLIRVGFAGGELWLQDTGEPLGQSIRVRVLARDVSLTLSPHQDTSILNRLETQIKELARDKRDPGMVLVDLKLGETHLIARLTRRSAEQLQLAPGQTVWAQIKSAALVR